MNRGQSAGEGGRGGGVGQPAAVADAVAPQGLQRLRGIADAVDVERQAGGAGGGEEEALQLCRALAVAPVADPDQTLPRLFDRRRVEQADVGGLVPDEDPAIPAPTTVDFGQGFAEREHAVVAGQVEGADAVRLADRAVVGVVEQQDEAAAALAGAADGGDEGGIVPLVDDDKIGAVQRTLDAGGPRVAGGGQFRIGAPPWLQPGLAVVGDQVGPAPRVLRLPGLDAVAAGDQFAQHAAQEVGVAVVPAGLKGMGEVDDLHAAASGHGARAASARA